MPGVHTATAPSITGPTIPHVTPTPSLSGEVPGRSGSTFTVVGDCTDDITYRATNDRVWEAWNVVFTLAQSTLNSAATDATVYTIQRGLQALANEMILTNDQVWNAWNVQFMATSAATGSTATITANDVVWNVWNRQYAAEDQARENRIRRQIAERRQPSAEEQERWRQEELRRREAEARARKEAAEADLKAIALLKSCLTPEQQEEYEQKKCFHLLVGDKRYRIEQGSHGNVKLIDKNGRVKRSFCVQPRGVPDGDAMLAQKLLLQTDEKRFYELANVTEHGPNGEHLRTLHAPRGADLLREVQQRTG
jgi:hypothetical protein